MQLLARLPPTRTRVEQATPAAINQAIRARTNASVTRMEEADGRQIAARLARLDREWNVERLLQLNAALIAGAGLLLGTRIDARFLLLPVAVFSFLAQHALQGWCPPIALFRRLGVRTAGEIERERQALKALRGDFDRVPPAGRANPTRRVRAALRAVDA